ncbi:hypothetical protein [Polaromonas sp.]|uniref:hypothetical protein n=1 Tax=Polaromonas sp. TaxID=1869339 RepID=UPI002486FDE3|nr:hypothetical protein [Polaromonas sp.]MDI1272062.1 hypothetical protein [Polaromonas sp.]
MGLSDDDGRRNFGLAEALSATRPANAATRVFAILRRPRPGGFAKRAVLLSNMLTKGSNSLVLLHYKIKHPNSKIASASRHYEAHASGLLDMQRHCMSSQTFD